MADTGMEELLAQAEEQVRVFKARAEAAEKERDEWEGVAAKSRDRYVAAEAEVERLRLSAAAVISLYEVAETREAELRDLLRDGADMAERYMGTLSGGLESWVVLVRAALTTHPADEA